MSHSSSLQKREAGNWKLAHGIWPSRLLRRQSSIKFSDYSTPAQPAAIATRGK
jgi:hypothetical protein